MFEKTCAFGFVGIKHFGIKGGFPHGHMFRPRSLQQNTGSPKTKFRHIDEVVLDPSMSS